MAAVRLDTWLDVACLFKTRSEAQKACKLGKVSVNGAAAKPHRDVKIGDELEIQRPMGRKQLITVLGLAETPHPEGGGAAALRGSHAEADARGNRDPALERIYRAAATPPTRPDRDQRRTLRRLKRGE